jgi:hypothetical protein
MDLGYRSCAARPMSQMGQNAKYSARADVFRSSPPRTDVDLAGPKTLRYGISIAQDFRFVPIAIAALARTDERRHHDVFARLP